MAMSERFREDEDEDGLMGSGRDEDEAGRWKTKMVKTKNIGEKQRGDGREGWESLTSDERGVFSFIFYSFIPKKRLPWAVTNIKSQSYFYDCCRQSVKPTCRGSFLAFLT